MTDQTGKGKPRRLSKGQRTHLRRVKQAARKTAAASSINSTGVASVASAKKE